MQHGMANAKTMVEAMRSNDVETLKTATTGGTEAAESV
jgi:hypothetical protein